MRRGEESEGVPNVCGTLCKSLKRVCVSACELTSSSPSLHPPTSSTLLSPPPHHLTLFVQCDFDLSHFLCQPLPSACTSYTLTLQGICLFFSIYFLLLLSVCLSPPPSHQHPGCHVHPGHPAPGPSFSPDAGLPYISPIPSSLAALPSAESPCLPEEGGTKAQEDRGSEGPPVHGTLLQAANLLQSLHRLHLVRATHSQLQVCTTTTSPPGCSSAASSGIPLIHLTAFFFPSTLFLH